jgi:hypothetical protein
MTNWVALVGVDDQFRGGCSSGCKVKEEWIFRVGNRIWFKGISLFGYLLIRDPSLGFLAHNNGSHDIK